MNLFRALCLILVGGVAALALLTVSASAQTETILYSFTGGSDGASPYPGLTPDGKGNFFGTAEFGGANYGGAVFELSPSTNGTWTESVIFSFGSNAVGEFPTGGVTMDGRGNLYGLTFLGGLYFSGVAYELSPSSSGTWSETILYNFDQASAGAGFYAADGLIWDTTGNLYGTTSNGGPSGDGTVFQLVQASDGTWTENTLYSFTGKDDGGLPYSRLLFDKAGNLYGTGVMGGAHDSGVLFEFIPESNGTWTETIVHAFTGGAGSVASTGALTMDQSGNLYANTVFAVMKFSKDSKGQWNPTILHQFLGGPDGADGESKLLFDSAGNLFGTTMTGGTHRGTVFELSPTTTGHWKEKILHCFEPKNDAIFPEHGVLVEDSGGNLYGAAQSGGAYGQGAIFEITPAAH